VSDPRYPYTYATDLMRNQLGPHISRAHASKIIALVADTLDMNLEDVAIKMADRYQELVGEYEIPDARVPEFRSRKIEKEES